MTKTKSLQEKLLVRCCSKPHWIFLMVHNDIDIWVFKEYDHDVWSLSLVLFLTRIGPEQNILQLKNC